MKLSPQTAARLLPVALLAIGVIIMGLIAALPFMRLNTLDQSLAENQAHMLQLRKQIAREGELRKENSDLAALGQDESLLLQGDTTGIAGANLQKLMSGLLQEHGADASSLQILPAKEDGNLMRIPMSLSISVGIDGLRDILHSIETGSPLIFIDDIAIRSTANDLPVPNPNYLGPLEVTLQVSGYVLKNRAS